MNSLIIPGYGKIFRKDIDSSEFKRLQSDGQYIDSLSEKFSARVFRLKSGEGIVERHGNYTFYKSYDDLVKVFENFDLLAKPVEILYGRNKFGEDFPKYSDEIINSMLTELNIPKSLISEDLLRKVDSAIDRLKDPDEFRDEYFINCVAIVGELLIKNNSCKWNMSLSDDGETWNCHLSYKGETIIIVKYLYEDMFDNKFDDPLSMTYNSIVDIITFSRNNKKE